MPRGQPEIVVAFDVDADGILNVSAEEKKSGKKQTITITNDGSRLNQEDIDKMVENAEKYKKEDEDQRHKIYARNNYENYIFHTKTTVQDATMKKKLGDQYDAIMSKLEKAEEVLQVGEVSKEEYEMAQQELEQYINPIMERLVTEGGGERMYPDVPSEVPQEVPIEEID
jgi:L1 cell adhesion molecule like protein